MLVKEGLSNPQLIDSILNARFTRRAALDLGLKGLAILSVTSLMPLINACSQEQEALEVKDIRKDLGEWSQEEVEFLAQEMLGESQFNNISYAGKILLDNQRGNPSLSTVSPLFNDDKIKFINIENIDASNQYGRKILARSLMMSDIQRTGDYTEIKLISKADQSTLNITTRTALRFKRIYLNHDSLKESTNFLLKLLVAKEIFNAKAFDMASSFILERDIDQKFTIDKNILSRKGVQIALMEQSKIGEMPFFFMADAWAHFLMLPNYNLAREQGRFSSKEVQNDLSVFQFASARFQEEGILTKDQEGIYRWIDNSDKFFKSWVETSELLFEALTKKP